MKSYFFGVTEKFHVKFSITFVVFGKISVGMSKVLRVSKLNSKRINYGL